jgi:hypothetical protein
MPHDSDPREVDFELAILRFWAEGIGITQRFSRQQIMAVPGLAAAIEAVKALPAAIGWDDEEPQEHQAKRASRQAQDKDG